MRAHDFSSTSVFSFVKRWIECILGSKWNDTSPLWLLLGQKIERWRSFVTGRGRRDRIVLWSVHARNICTWKLASPHRFEPSLTSCKFHKKVRYIYERRRWRGRRRGHVDFSFFSLVCRDAASLQVRYADDSYIPNALGTLGWVRDVTPNLAITVLIELVT